MVQTEVVKWNATVASGESEACFVLLPLREALYILLVGLRDQRRQRSVALTTAMLTPGQAYPQTSEYGTYCTVGFLPLLGELGRYFLQQD